MFFVSQFKITWPRFPEIGAHDAFIHCYVESKFQHPRFYRLLVIKQINPRMPKFVDKNNGTTRSREVPIATNNSDKAAITIYSI